MPAPLRRVMGLDVSSRRFGWALFDGENWQCGCAECPHKRPRDQSGLDALHTGRVVNWLRATLTPLVREHDPDWVGIEKPLVPSAAGARTNDHTIHALNAAAAVAAGVAEAFALPVSYVDQSRWRSRFGMRSLTKADRRTLANSSSSWLKGEAMRVAQLHGASPSNGDEADACGIAYALYVEANPRVADLFASGSR